MTQNKVHTPENLYEIDENLRAASAKLRVNIIGALSSDNFIPAGSDEPAHDIEAFTLNR